MSFTTTSSLWRPSITLSSSTSTLLWSRLLARASNITGGFHPLPHIFAFVLEVFESFVGEISSQGLVEKVMVERHIFIGEATSDKAIDRHLDFLCSIERSHGPRLGNK